MAGRVPRDGGTIQPKRLEKPNKTAKMTRHLTTTRMTAVLTRGVITVTGMTGRANLNIFTPALSDSATRGGSTPETIQFAHAPDGLDSRQLSPFPLRLATSLRALLTQSRQHVMEFHRLKLPHSCPWCSTAFGSQQDVIDHMGLKECEGTANPPVSAARLDRTQDDPENGISAETVSRMGSRRSACRISNWRELCQALFPGDLEIQFSGTFSGRHFFYMDLNSLTTSRVCVPGHRRTARGRDRHSRNENGDREQVEGGDFGSTEAARARKRGEASPKHSC